MDSGQNPNTNNQTQLTVNYPYPQAINHFNTERYTQADKLFTAIIQAVPNHIDAQNLLGIIVQKSVPVSGQVMQKIQSGFLKSVYTQLRVRELKT
jgi:hypothetical protein